MQRLQPAAASHATEDVPDLPLPPDLEIRSLPLLQRLDSLREPGVTQQEVDLFLKGLSAVLPAQESPRVRADLMLDILEDSRLCELTGSDGGQVGATALEVLLTLGYPYALEVTPAMLARVREAEPSTLPPSVPVGLGVAGATGLVYLVTFLPQFLDLLELRNAYHGRLPTSALRGFDDTAVYLPLFMALFLGPTLLTGLTWICKLHGARPYFNLLQWIVGVAGLWLGLTGHLLGLGSHHPLGVLSCSALTLVSAFCLRPREDPEQAPSGPDAGT